MNLHRDVNRSGNTLESRNLWQDGRVWWVNCVAIEAGWSPEMTSDLSAARRQRDLILAALIQVW